MSSPNFPNESTRRIIDEVWGDEDALEREQANLRNHANLQAMEPAPHRVEALQIQRRTDVPWDVAELDIEEVRARDAYQQLGPVRVENSPAWGTFLTSSLAPVALKNPENTRAIADAIDLRVVGSQRPGVLSAATARGLHMVEVGKLGHRVMLGIASDADLVRFDRMRRNWPEVPDEPGYVDDVAALLAEQAPVLASIATYAGAGAGAAGLVGLGSGPGALAFAGGGGLLGAGYGGFVLEGGNAYAEFLDIAEEIRRGPSGEVIPPGAIRGAAIVVGLLNAGMEVGGIGLLLRITGLSKLKGKLTRKGAVEIIKSKTLRPYLVSFAKRMTQAMGVEGGTEILQEAVNVAAADILVEATTNQERDLTWEEIFTRLGKAGVAGAVVGGSIQVGAAPIVAAAERVALNRQTRDAEKRLDAITEAVSSGELAGADPAALRSWLQGMLEEGGGDPNLYVPPENLVELFQEDEALAEAMPGVLEQLAEALATGGDVVVPIADYATYLGEHHEALKGVVRHGLGERTMAEVEATETEDEAALQTEIDALAGTEEGAAELTPGEQVAQSFIEQAIRTGAMRPEDAQFVGSLLQAQAETRAEGVAGERAFEQLEGMEVEGPAAEAAPPTLEESLARVDIDTLLNTLRKAPEAPTPEVAQLAAVLEQLGFDLDQMTNEQIIGELESRFAPTTLEQAVGAEDAPVPESVDAASSLDGASELALGKKWRTGRDLKAALQERVLAAAEEAGVDLSLDNEETHEYLVRVGVQDALNALNQNANAVGWYDLKTRQALAVVSLVHPEVVKDPDSRFAFVYILATTSNGLDVGINFRQAEKVYRAYKEAGSMPTDMGIGESADAVNKTLQLFNALASSWGIENLRDFMLTDMTVGDIGRVEPSLKPGGEHVATQVRGAAIIGPKIGNGFFSNLYGMFDQLTMDRWLIRTWGRWTGTLLKVQPEQTQRAFERLRSASESVSPEDIKTMEELLESVGVPPVYPDAAAKIQDSDAWLAELALAIQKVSMKPANRSRMNQTEAGAELRKAGNSLAGYLDAQKEDPSGPTERNQIRRVFGSMLAELQKDPKYADLTMADLQAVLWYSEKRLYETAKDALSDGTTAGYEDTDAPDYANAAVALAQSLGVKDSRIQRALKREENGRARAARPRAPEREGVEEQPEEARGFVPSERKRFLGGLATLNARSNRGGGSAVWGYSRRTRRVRGGDGLLEWVPGKSLRRIYKSAGVVAPTFVELESTPENASRFAEAVEASKGGNQYGAAVHVYPSEEYQGMRLLLSESGQSGVAIKSDGDIVSLFSSEGSGRSVVEVAIQAGGTKADAFDTVLPHLYSAHGLRVVSRLKWDDSEAPAGWDKDTFRKFNNGEPDVVFMVVDPEYVSLYLGTEGVASKSYDSAVRAQKKAIRAVAKAAPTTLEQPAGAPKVRAAVVRVTLPSGEQRSFRGGWHGEAYQEAENALGDSLEDASVEDNLFELTDGAIITDTEALRLFPEASTGVPAPPNYAANATTARAPISTEEFEMAGHPVIEPESPEVGLIPEAPATLEQPTGKGIRGSLTYDPELNNILMRFTEAKNLSTALHESGHLFFVMMMQDAQTEGASPQLLADMQAALDYLGAESIESLTTEQHEVWARSFEAYLREGKAPSVELRAAFERFKRWLLQVYRTLRGLDVELTPEIREVFDRLLATEEQIALASEQDRMLPAFDNAAEAGMTEAEYEAYRQAHERAHIQAEQQTTKKLLAELKREKTEEWRDNYEKMRAAVEADINAKPITQLRHWLQFGTLLTEDTPDEIKHIRLDRAILENRYGRGIVKLLGGTGRYGMVQSDGVDPDAMARVFGFESGDTLVRELQASQNRKRAIEEETTRRMKETYGDILNDGTLPELAMDAMENDAKGNFLVRQGRILARRAGGADTPQGLARRAARRAVAGKSIRSLSPHRYRLAEQRAARQVLDAVDAQDWQAAHEAGRKQLLNHFLIVEATKAKELATKWRTYLRKMDTKATRERIGRAGEDYLDQIDSLLARFDLRQISNKAADRRAALATWITEQEAEDPTVGIVIDENLRNEAFTKPWREMTVEELGGLTDAIKNIEHLALLKRKLLLAKDQRDLDARVDEVLESTEANRRLDRAAVPIEPRTTEEENIRKAGQWHAIHRKFASLLSEMDGGPGGAWFDLVLRPMDERSDYQTVEREKAWETLAPLFAPFLPFAERAKMAATRATLGQIEGVKPEIETSRLVPGTANVELTLQGRLMAVLNMGNAGNKQRLIDNYGWSEQDAQAIIDSLSKEEMDFVQNIWEFIETYWQAIAAKERRVTGVAPTKVERTPVQTRHGEYAGGYFPAKYDVLQSERTRGNAVAQASADTMRGARTRATTQRGWTKERVEKVTGQKIRLDFGVIFEHVDGVILDLAWHEWLIDTNKLLTEPRVSDAIITGYGEPVYRALTDTLQDIAAGDVPAQGIWEASLNWIRMGSSIAGMGYNVMTALLQPYGLTQSMVRIGPKWVGRGISKWFRGPGELQSTVQWIYSKSAMMKTRSTTMNREIREIQSRVTKGGLFDPVSDSYFYLIVKGQQIVDIPTWLGAYTKEMEVGSGNEGRAVAMADRAVIDAQGGGQIQDLAGVQRGGPLLKLWTNFYSFFNTTFNLTAESYQRTDFRSPRSAGRFAVDMLLLYTVPAVLSELMRDAIMDDWDEDESWAEYIARTQLSYMAGTMMFTREFSGVIQGYYGYDGPAGTRFFSAASRFMAQAAQGEVDAALLKAANAAGGILLHYPAVEVQRFTEGMIAIEKGETQNPARLLTGPSRENR